MKHGYMDTSERDRIGTADCMLGCILQVGDVVSRVSFSVPGGGKMKHLYKRGDRVVMSMAGKSSFYSLDKGYHGIFDGDIGVILAGPQRSLYVEFEKECVYVMFTQLLPYVPSSNQDALYALKR